MEAWDSKYYQKTLESTLGDQPFRCRANQHSIKPLRTLIAWKMTIGHKTLVELCGNTIAKKGM